MPSYSSINFMAWEYWTDGHAEGSLAPPGDGLRRCICGECFVIYSPKLELVRSTRHSKPIAPIGWSTRRDNWITRAFGRESRDEVRERYDVRPVEEIELERIFVPPSPGYVSRDELKQLADSQIVDPEVAMTVRRLYWRHLNESHRDVFRTFREAHKEEVNADGTSSTFPPFEPSAEQVLNIEKLCQLLESADSPRWLEIAELRRELADFSGAAEALTHIEGEKERLHLVVDRLVTMKVQGPVRYYF